VPDNLRKQCRLYAVSDIQVTAKIFEYKADLKGIFGSYAREDAKADSDIDIDILVEFQEDATLFDLCGMGDFLEEKLHHKVDVVCQSAIREEIRPYILSKVISCNFMNLMKTVFFSVVFYYTAIRVFKIG
jgi:uncharacterized protein